MSVQTHSKRNDMGTLAEDARALMTATADVAGEKVADGVNYFITRNIGVGADANMSDSPLSTRNRSNLT